MIKIKISFDLQPISKNRTGIAYYSIGLLKEINKYNEIETIGCAFDFVNRNDTDRIIKEFCKDSKINSCAPYGVYRRADKYLHISYNKLFDVEADIYHFFNFTVPYNISGKVITTIHDMAYKLYPNTVQKRNLHRLNGSMEYSVNRADKIITVSENSKQDIMKFFNVEDKKIGIVSPGVDYEKFNQKSEKMEYVRGKYSLPEKYILYMGAIEPRKNIETILKVYNSFRKENDEYKLVIAGGVGWNNKAIFSLIKELQIKDAIFTGYVDEEDKVAVYQLASLFFFPSLYEGFGMPIIEAMAAGVPVVASDVGILKEMGKDACLKYEPLDEKGFLNGIEKVLSDKEFARKLIDNGKKEAQKFSWGQEAEKMVRIYKSLME